MATVIKAGNVASGAQVTSDATGILQLNTGSGAGTTALTLDTSQNVGVGTTSPSVSGLDISRATGSASPTPVELRLATTTSASDWSTTNPWGRLSFYSADASVGGAKVHASIQTTAQSSAGGNSNLDFFVTDTANGTLFRTLSFQGAGTNTTQTLFYSGGGTNTMTLTAAGDFLVGATSAATGVSGSETSLTLQGNSSGKAASFVAVNNAGTGAGYLGVGADNITYVIGKSNAALVLGANNTERARITSTGNFAIGTTSTANYGDRGLYVSGNGGGYTAVSIGASGGDYGVIGYNTGFTSTAGTYKAIASDGMSWIRFLNGAFEFWNQLSATGGTNYTGTRRALISAAGAFETTAYVKSDTYIWAAGSGAGAIGYYLGAAGADNGRISQTSAGTGTTTTYIGNQAITTSSDIRLKENVVPTERNALELLQQWEIVDHTWNDPSDQAENNRNSRGVWTGVVAQQVQPITPWLVNKPLEEINEDGSINPWTMDFGYAVPLLVKAIQELKAELDATKAEVAALKGAAQ